MTRAEDILHYWFGRIEETVLPSSHRTGIWFGQAPEVDQEIKTQFGEDLIKAVEGGYNTWKKTARSSLALIILFDQFSRHIYRHAPQSFAQDPQALSLCLYGIEYEYDHTLSLVERVFFYMPLMHAENIEMQAASVRAYKILTDLSFPEARPLFENFLDYAIKHYEVIKAFDRFPTRNKILGRESTADEITFLNKQDDHPTRG